MTNTLTWENPILRVPQLNANLLALISMISLCAMTFLMVHPALAEHCGPEQEALQAALAAMAACEIAVVAAIWTGAGVAIALTALAAAMLAVRACESALQRCLNEHEDDSAGCY